MLRSRAHEFHKLIVCADVAVTGAVFALAHAVIGSGAIASPLGNAAAPVEPVLVIAMVGMIAWPLALDALGLYESQRRRSLLGVGRRLLGAGVLATAAMTLTAATVVTSVDPLVALLAGALQVVTLASLRMGMLAALRVLRLFGRNYRRILIVGSGPRALRAAQMIDEHPAWGQRVIGLLDEYDEPREPALARYPLHKLTDLPELLRREVVDEVIIACPRAMLPSLVPIVATSALVGVPVTMLSDLFGDLMPPPQPAEFGSMPALSFGVVSHGTVALICKRGIDLLGAGVLLLLAAPVLAAAALAIKLDSPGPVLFRQKRCGLNGRIFDVLKLRTMRTDAEQVRAELAYLNEMDGPVFKIRNDPRVTRVGAFLRRLSLDELPQLWNVMVGDMSLVGPRPPLPSEVDMYQIFQRRRLSMRPGITCLWQVKGRNTIGFSEWVRLDLEYIDRWSLLLDFSILARTLPAVLKGTGAS